MLLTFVVSEDCLPNRWLVLNARKTIVSHVNEDERMLPVPLLFCFPHDVLETYTLPPSSTRTPTPCAWRYINNVDKEDKFSSRNISPAML